MNYINSDVVFFDIVIKLLSLRLSRILNYESFLFILYYTRTKYWVYEEFREYSLEVNIYIILLFLFFMNKRTIDYIDTKNISNIGYTIKIIFE